MRMKKLKQYYWLMQLQPERPQQGYPMKTIEEIAARMPHATTFSVLDD